MQMSCVDLTDTDNDGILDIDEDLNNDNDLDNDDLDNDGIPNYLDVDDDGDGVNTEDEDRDNDGNPANDDSDGDQTPDYLDVLDVLIFDTEFIGTGCFPSYSFDLDLLVTQSYSGLINNTYSFYVSESDAQLEVNPLSNPYVTGFFDLLYVRATNTITNHFDIAVVYLNEDYIDSDGDGLTDCEELTGIDSSSPDDCHPNGNITDPFDSDSDDDGYEDCIEAQYGTDPNDPTSFPDIIDSDGDSVLDSQEAIDGTDPNNVCDYNVDFFNFNNVTNAWYNADCDNDGLSNLEEVSAEIDGFTTGYLPTDPFNSDSDGDGVSDFDEINNGTDPNDPTSN
jgi:hypothetical protein